MKTHQAYLSRTVQLASKRLGFCAPNPAVGAVVVKDGKVLSEGFHLGCGHQHAEVEALNKLGDAAKEATLYVSLEPCCHFGRTPPCTERIKKSGIKQVYFGLLDPNPTVAGKGQAELIEAGVACEQIKLPEINKFYQPYQYWTIHKKPRVSAKLAMSGDHKIALANRQPVSMTGKACQQLTHVYRQQSDAILTTITTILHDDPQLNVRLENAAIQKPLYVLDSQCRLALNAKIFETAKSITVFHSKNADPSATTNLKAKGVRCIEVQMDVDGLALNIVLEKIGEEGIHTLWVEAGAKCFNAFVNQQLLARAICYVSPLQLGDDALDAGVNWHGLHEQAMQVRKKMCDKDAVYQFKFKEHACS